MGITQRRRAAPVSSMICNITCLYLHVDTHCFWSAVCLAVWHWKLPINKADCSAAPRHKSGKCDDQPSHALPPCLQISKNSEDEAMMNSCSLVLIGVVPSCQPIYLLISRLHVVQTMGGSAQGPTRFQASKHAA